MTEPTPSILPLDHDLHDRLAVAALAARDPGSETTDVATARAQVAACGQCADLLADLLAVQAAVPSAAVPTRPRDFTLTAADAARLRPARWRRLLGAIGSARDGVSRPLAMGLTTLGIAGLLAASIPAIGGLGGSTGAILSTVGDSVGRVNAAPPAAAQGSGLDLLSGEPESERSADGGVFQGGGEAAAPSPETDIASGPAEAAIRDDRTGMSTLIVLAGSLLIMGLGLFGLRWSARRFGDG